MSNALYRFKNWEKYQSFNHKRPVHTWKKVYIDTPRDFKYSQGLKLHEKAWFFELILLADAATGEIPGDIEELRFHLSSDPNYPQFELEPFLKFLIPVRDLREAQYDTGKLPVDDRQDAVQRREEVRGDKRRIDESRRDNARAGALAYSVPEPQREEDLKTLASIFGEKDWFEYAAVCRWYYDNHTAEFLGTLKHLQDGLNPEIRAAKGLSNPGTPSAFFLYQMKNHMRSIGRKLPSSKVLASS